LPHPLCVHCSLQIDKKIFLYGGTDGEQFLKTIYKLDLEEMVIYGFKMEGEGRIGSGMGLVDQKILIFGGSRLEEEEDAIITICMDDSRFTKIKDI